MDFYTSISAYYDRIFPVDPQALAFLGSGLEPGSRVLDIACGTGGYAIGLAEQGHQVTGIDLDRAMIRRARGKARELARPPASKASNGSGDSTAGLSAPTLFP